MKAAVGLIGMAAFGLVGCAELLPKLSSPNGAKGHDARYLNFNSTEFCSIEGPRRYDGPTYTAVSSTATLAEPVPARLRSIMCHEEVGGDLHHAIYATLDERAPDDFAVAQMLIACVADGECAQEKARPFGRMHFSLSFSADVYRFARGLDMHRVEANVKALHLPADVEQAFLERADACRKSAIENVEAFNPRARAVYVDTIEQTVARRMEDETALASFYARYKTVKPELDSALIEGHPTDALRAKAQDLRDGYVEACRARGRTAQACAAGPVGRPMTEYLVRLAIAFKDPVTATAESTLMAMSPDQTDVRYEIHLAVSKAMRHETELSQKYAEAKRLGTDEGVLAQKFGPVPPLDLSDYGNGAGIDPPRSRSYEAEVGALSHGGSGPVLDWVRRKITRVELGRGNATVYFADHVTTDEHQTGCYETTKIDAITHDGELRYRVECNGPWVKEVHHDAVAPVRVSSAEGVGLSAGQFAFVVADTKSRRGAVVEVFASEKDKEPVQIRQWPTRAR